VPMQFMLDIVDGSAINPVVRCNCLVRAWIIEYGNYLLGCRAIFASPPISGLFFRCRPSAIARFVVAVIIGPTIQTFVGRCFAHIGEKISKDVPALADCDAAPTVVRIVFDVGVVTPVEHAVPSSVSFSYPASTRVPMGCSRNVSLGIFRSYYFFVVTATRQCASLFQAISTNDHFLTAIAKAQPFSPTLRFIALKDKQAAKSLTGDINKGGHGDLSERLLVSSGGAGVGRTSLAAIMA